MKKQKNYILPLLVFKIKMNRHYINQEIYITFTYNNIKMQKNTLSQLYKIVKIIQIIILNTKYYITWEIFISII